MLWGNNAQEEVGQYLYQEKILKAQHPRLDGFIKENYLVMQGTELKTDPYLKESIDSLYDLLKLNKLL